MSANQGKSRRSAGELPDIELKTRFREIGLWEEKLRLLKYDRHEDIEQKAVFEDLLDYFLKLQAVSIREQGRRKCLTRLKSAWQELAAIEAKISATTAEEKRVLEGVRTRCQDCVFALQEAAVEAERECSELEQEIGGNVEYVAYINRALDRMGMKPDCDLRPELLLAEDPVPAATEPLNTARETVADAVKKKLNNPSQYRGMLIEEVRIRDKSATFECLSADRMRSAGEAEEATRRCQELADAYHDFQCSRVHGEERHRHKRPLTNRLSAVLSHHLSACCPITFYAVSHHS